jgi:exodeoxyribonuclease V gamma subunit
LLFVERSNRTELLLEGLSARLMTPGRDPLAPAVVVVQGRGMERWIAQSVARRHGVCANVDFLFPKAFVERVFAATGDAVPPSNPGWEVGRLRWHVAQQLHAHRDDDRFTPLVRHLEAADGDRRLVQLASRIADLLDQYVTYRPDWIRDWVAGGAPDVRGDALWQPRLVQAIHAEVGPGHIADRALAFAGAIAAGPGDRLVDRLQARLPDLVEIFAVSTLPPLYLSVIQALSRARDVRLSVLSPSRQYWADLWREVSDEAEAEPAAAPDGDAAVAGGVFGAGATTPVAAFLAGLGRLGADFQSVLEEVAPDHAEVEPERFTSPVAVEGTPRLLAGLQQRLLDLDAERSADGPETRVAWEDDSIGIHLCHGPRRELEVVESLLLDAFERDPTLRPEDVIVMAPAIDEIAADVEAVFGAAGEARPSIPFHIADRGAFRGSPVAEALRELLALLVGRCTRSEVLDWLAREPVREAFDLDEAAVERLGEWADRAGIRFGLDEAHRADLGLARERAHTWADGLDRLALAHAVGASDAVFRDTAPVGLGIASDPQWLGALGDVVSLLVERRAWAGAPRSVREWCHGLRSLLSRAFARTDANAHEHAAIHALLDELTQAAEGASFDHSIPFEAIRDRVLHGIESNPAPQAFLAGGVTFCELVPLRAIPFRVVVLIGMADDAFPRGTPAPAFDLMLDAPRRGDRTPRSDDRYLFLEALLSARDRLIVTVPAFDLRDGSDRTPSVVVTDLIDTLAGLFEVQPNASSETDEPVDLRKWIRVQHPLRASSPLYFEAETTSRLSSRDAEAYAAALARQQAESSGGATPRAFLGRGTVALGTDAAASDERPTLVLDELVDRFLRSTRHFARHRLGLRLPRPEASSGDLDPSDLDALAEHGLGNALLDPARVGLGPGARDRRLLADPTMPGGLPGRTAAARLSSDVESIARILDGRRRGDRLPDVELDLRLDRAGSPGGSRITGRLDRLWPGGRIASDFSRIGRRAECDVWIRHLVLCALVEDGLALTAESLLVGRPETGSDERVVLFGPVADPRPLLAQIFDWAWSAADVPLPFFPRTSRKFAEHKVAGKVDQGWRDAYLEFGGGDVAWGPTPEGAALEIQRVWEGVSPLESGDAGPVPYRFDGVAEAFFRPLLEARRVLRT